MNVNDKIRRLCDKCCDSTSPIMDLALEALLVAQCINDQDANKWLTNEIEGYKPEEVPDYRKVRAGLRYEYHDGGNILIDTKTNRQDFRLINWCFPLHEIASSSKLVNSGSSLQFTINDDNGNMLEIYASHRGVKVPVLGMLEPDEIDNIIGAVRGRIFAWVSKLNVSYSKDVSCKKTTWEDVVLYMEPTGNFTLSVDQNRIELTPLSLGLIDARTSMPNSAYKLFSASLHRLIENEHFLPMPNKKQDKDNLKKRIVVINNALSRAAGLPGKPIKFDRKRHGYMFHIQLVDRRHD